MDAFRDYSKFLIFYRFLINVKFRVKTQNSAYKYKHYNSLWKRWIRLISGYSAVFYISLPFPSTFFRASHLISSRRLLISFWISLWPSRRRNPCLCNRQIFLSYRIHSLCKRSDGTEFCVEIQQFLWVKDIFQFPKNASFLTSHISTFCNNKLWYLRVRLLRIN